MKLSSPIYWDKLFAPSSVAVIGASATPGSWGYNVMRGLLSAPGRRIYAVNPKVAEVLGLKTFPKITDVPETVDLAIIVVPAHLVPGILKECADKGIKMAGIITAGFGETGAEGEKLEADMLRVASESGIRFFGPNSMGHGCSKTHLATFGYLDQMPIGPVSLLSQSGSMAMTVIRNASDSGIYFNKAVSTGNETTLIMEDYLEHLAQDEDTRLITAYIEGLRDGRRFLELARRITRKKPMVVIKAGGTRESAKTVRSHTGALAGSDPVYSAAFKQTGIIRVEDDEELCEMVQALLNSPLPRNNRVGILSVGGGPAALAAEACEKEGLAVGAIGPGTIAKLDQYLPPRWSHSNPVDMAGPAMSDLRFVLPCIHALLEDENIDFVFVQAPIIGSKEMIMKRMNFGPDQFKAYRDKEKEDLKAIDRKVEETGKPVVLSWLSKDVRSDPEVTAILRGIKILSYSSSKRAARVMRNLFWYRRYLDHLK